MKKTCAEIIVLRSLLLGGVLGFLGSSLYLVGCESVGPAVNIAIGVLTNQTANTPSVIPADVTGTQTETTAQDQSLWPYVEVDWMIHGEGLNENEVRAAAIREAAATGKALKFKFHDSGTDLRFWLFWWESDVDKGKFPNPEMGTPKATQAGVKRWVVDVTGQDDALVIDTFKAYGDADHQLQVIGSSPGVIKGLGLDGQGIKTTPPRYR